VIVRLARLLVKEFARIMVDDLDPLQAAETIEEHKILSHIIPHPVPKLTLEAADLQRLDGSDLSLTRAADERVEIVEIFEREGVERVR
jgi:hypothetical protein